MGQGSSTSTLTVFDLGKMMRMRKVMKMKLCHMSTGEMDEKGFNMLHAGHDAKPSAQLLGHVGQMMGR